MKALFIITCFMAGIMTQAQTINYTFDKQGRLKSEQVEPFYLMQFTYDAEGNLISKTVTNYSPLAIPENDEKSNTWKVYPNPANQFIVVENNDNSLTGEISIIDILGRKIEKNILHEGRTYINVGNYKTGIYLVKIKTAKETFIYKVNISPSGYGL